MAYGVPDFDFGGGGGTAALSAANPWLAAGKFAIDTVGSALGADEQREMQKAQMKQQWEMFLANLNQQRSEQDDARGRTAMSLASRQAMLPLVDRGFTALQQRFAQGPATFGETGAQNKTMQMNAANYQPGQNKTIQDLGANWQMLANRFNATQPALTGGGIVDDTKDEGRPRLPHRLSY